MKKGKYGKIYYLWEIISMSVRKSDLYNFIPMDIKDLNKIYNLELESYDYPWTKEILRDCILYKYDSFSVTIEPGTVRKGELLGIMGANALGKTTMMKMIAGVEKPTEGSVDKKIKISYKPQYLSNDIDVEVISVLEKSNGSSIEGSTEEEQILDPLKLKKL